MPLKRNASSCSKQGYKVKAEICMWAFTDGPYFLAEVVTKEDTVVDATMGNGHDTLSG